MTRSLVRTAAPLACAATLALAACTSGDPVDPSLTGGGNTGATVFLAQSAPPGAVMQALFQGTVVRDAQGCLRLDSPQPATVIWPHGFTLEARGGRLYVEDAAGREIGRIGGSFRFGGGYSPTHDHLSLTPADHALADSRCPGEYWIVGETD